MGGVGNRAFFHEHQVTCCAADGRGQLNSTQWPTALDPDRQCRFTVVADPIASFPGRQKGQHSAKLNCCTRFFVLFELPITPPPTITTRELTGCADNEMKVRAAFSR
jgi:hypothetical protein